MNAYSVLEKRTDLISIVTASGMALATPAPETTALPGANLARFWELRGRRVIEAHGILWGQYKGPFFTSLPFHLKLDLEREELRRIFRETSVKALRFPSTNRPGLAAGMYVCRPEGYGLQSVSRTQKAHVIRGLDACEIRPVDPGELRSEGIQLNRDTLARQERQDPTFLDPARWSGFVDAVERTPGMTVYGSYSNGRLSAYLIGCREGEWFHLMYKMSRTADHQNYPNHALDFWFVTQAAKTPGVRFVGNGFSSVVPNPGLDRYKRQLGYELAEHNLCLHFNPILEPVLTNKVTVAIARRASAALPKNEGLAYKTKILEGARLSAAAAEPSASEDLCQQEEAGAFSRLRRPASLFPALRVYQTLTKGGLGHTVEKTKDYLRRKLSGRSKIAQPTTAPRRPLTADEVLNLKPGDLVEVKSEAEIRATLDERGKTRGLLFTADMQRYAGQRFRVFKRVESIFLEESKQRRTIKNTVILETVYCPGVTFRCDRSCFLFWKEAWLRRVEPENEQPAKG